MISKDVIKFPLTWRGKLKLFWRKIRQWRQPKLVEITHVQAIVVCPLCKRPVRECDAANGYRH